MNKKKMVDYGFLPSMYCSNAAMFEVDKNLENYTVGKEVKWQLLPSDESFVVIN